jgi:hypothetical protein
MDFSKNPRILAPLIIILEQNLKYKSCRIKKNVPKLIIFLHFLVLLDKKN